MDAFDDMVAEAELREHIGEAADILGRINN